MPRARAFFVAGLDMHSMRTLIRAASFFAIALAAGSAFADKIALLPSRGANASVDPAAVAALDIELAKDLLALGHSVVPAPEVAAAIKRTVQDGVADTAEEYKAVGAATKADWVVVGTIEPAVGTARVELTAYLMSMGRVEAVAREVEKARSEEQEKEMLAVLVQPQGIGVGDFPWEKRAPLKVPQPEPPPAQQTKVVAPPPPPEAPARDVVSMDYMSTTDDVWPAYGNKRVMLAALQGFSVPAVKPKGATGSGFAMVIDARGGTTIGDRGFEIFADLGGNAFGPKAIFLDGGARWMFTPSMHRMGDHYAAGSWFVGPEIDLGAFFELPPPAVTLSNGTTLSASTNTRFVVGGSIDFVLAASKTFALDASIGNLRFIPSSEGSLLLFGATLGAQLRL